MKWPSENAGVPKQGAAGSRPGLKGDTATEILDGELKAGEAVAVRVKGAAERRSP